LTAPRTAPQAGAAQTEKPGIRAIRYDRYGGPDVLRLEEVPDPVPGPGEVLVRLHAASVVPADWKVRAGLLRHLFPVSLPKIPGRDGAGVVVACGPGADFAAPGDAVCVVAQHVEDGTCAGSIARPAHAVVPMPAGLSFAEGAALMHAGICAWIMLVETARAAPGMRVLVHAGAGAIGGLAVQLARHLGCEVAATCRAANAGYVEAMGAHRVLPYDRADFAAELRERDLVLDLLGGEVHARSYRVLRRGGHMVRLIAAPIEDRAAEHGIRLDLARIHDEPHALRAVVDLAGRGVLRPQVAALLPLAEAAEAHRRLEAGEVSRGRIVLDTQA
jgi:NADPH:quinone reductase-like Zn-dependent oxidoreductase